MRATETLTNWTASRINSANYCGMRWYLEYVVHVPKQRMSFFEKGSLLHSLIEKFWDEDRFEVKYHNPEEFAKYAQGQWMHKIIGAQKSEEPIFWRTPEEKWIMKAQIGNTAKNIFNLLMKEGKPMYTELRFDLFFDDIRYNGRIDSVRMDNGQLVIRDYKSGKPFNDEFKLRFTPQPTFYCLGMCGFIKTNPEFARRVGLEDEVNSILTKERVLSDKILFEYVLLDDPNLTVRRTSRDDIRYEQLVSMIRGIRRRFIDGTIYPEFGEKCKYCDVREACKERHLRSMKPSLIEEGGQVLLSLEQPTRPSDNPNLIISNNVSITPSYPVNGIEEQMKIKLRKSKVFNPAHN